MYYEWYVDTFWITLFLVDLIAFRVACLLLGKNRRLVRSIVLAIVSASLETMLFLFMYHYVLYRAVMILLVNPLITYFLFYRDTRKMILKAYFLISGVIILVGGVQTLFQNWLSIDNGWWIWQVLLALMAALFCIYQRKQSKHTQHQYQITLYLDGAGISLLAYHDTGNFLKDPYSGKPVSIIDGSVLRDFDIQKKSIRYIPYHTVGTDHGLLQVLTAQKMEIHKEDFVIEIESPVIGISEKELFLHKDMHMILHSELI